MKANMNISFIMTLNIFTTEPRSELVWARIVFLSLQPLSLCHSKQKVPSLMVKWIFFVHYLFMLTHLSWLCVWIITFLWSYLFFLDFLFEFLFLVQRNPAIFTITPIPYNFLFGLPSAWNLFLFPLKRIILGSTKFQSLLKWLFFWTC